MCVRVSRVRACALSMGVCVCVRSTGAVGASRVCVWRVCGRCDGCGRAGAAGRMGGVFA